MTGIRQAKKVCGACKRRECWDCVRHLTHTEWCEHLCDEVPHQLMLPLLEVTHGTVQARGERDLPGR